LYRPDIQGDLCKTPPFAQFRRQAQILILKILNVFLWLKFSPSLDLNKIERFSKVSQGIIMSQAKKALGNGQKKNIDIIY